MKWFVLIAILLNACSSDEASLNSPSTLSAEQQAEFDSQIREESKNFKMGKFDAKYYDNDRLVYSEEVDEASIDSDHDDLHGIGPGNLRMVWEGVLDVYKDNQVIDIKFKLSWAKIKLFANETLVIDAENSHRVTSHLFQKGKHVIRIEFENNWHTVGFHLWFTQNTKYTLTQAEPFVRPLIGAETELVYAGLYRSNNPRETVYIVLEERDTPTFLFLGSYAAVHFKVIAADGIDLKGIVYNSKSLTGDISATVEVPTYHISDFTVSYGDGDELGGTKADIKRFVDRYPDKVFLERDAQHIRVFR